MATSFTAGQDISVVCTDCGDDRECELVNYDKLEVEPCGRCNIVVYDEGFAQGTREAEEAAAQAEKEEGQG